MSFRKRSKKLSVAKNMPPLFHKLPGVDFDYRKSEVVRWLIQQPEILSFLWDQFKQSNDVVYDPTTGKWHGVGFDD